MTASPNYTGRLSVRLGDSGYENWRYVRMQGLRPCIYFNGEHVIGVITADPEAGMIVRFKEPQQYDSDRQQLVDEVAHGKVEIELHPENVL